MNAVGQDPVVDTGVEGELRVERLLGGRRCGKAERKPSNGGQNAERHQEPRLEDYQSCMNASQFANEPFITWASPQVYATPTQKSLPVATSAGAMHCSLQFRDRRPEKQRGKVTMQ